MTRNMTLFRSYSRDISKLKSGENCYDLIVKARFGDKEAINKIVENNIKLVVKIASSYNLHEDLFVEVINVGCLGLMKAIRKYNPSKGTKFSTYASFWIKSSINNFLSKNHLINISNSAKFKRHIIVNSNENNNLTNIQPNVLMLSELSDGLGLDLPSNSPTLQKFDEKYYEELLSEKISKLSPKEQFVIERRFGLNNKEIMSLREIGEILNTTPENIRYIESRALRKLRSMLINEIY